MSKAHIFRSSTQQPQKKRAKGQRLDINKENFPAISDMSISILTLQPNGVREPHWHPNANELSYCLEGRAVMTIYSPGGGHDTLIIEQGTITMVPRGYLHHIENIGKIPARFLICFDNERAEDLEISSSLKACSNSVLGATFALPPSEMEAYKQVDSPAFIFELDKHATPPLSAQSSHYNFNIEAIPPQVSNGGGWVKMCNDFLFPALKGMTFFSVNLAKGGAREPHWHPNSHELNYLMSGKARITLFAPDGTKESVNVEPGDFGFMPQGYLHILENIGDEPARFAVFFSNTAPNDIALSGSLGAYPNELLARLFNLPIEQINKLPKYQRNLFLVPTLFANKDKNAGN